MYMYTCISNYILTKYARLVNKVKKNNKKKKKKKRNEKVYNKEKKKKKTKCRGLFASFAITTKSNYPNTLLVFVYNIYMYIPRNNKEKKY